MSSTPEQPSHSSRRVGRPAASSSLVLEEAAVQLYLEQGYADTTVAQITARAGVSRSSFFNYFQGKSDVLWSGFDGALEALGAARHSEQPIIDELAAWANQIPAENVAIVFTQAEPMGLSAEDISAATGVRIMRLAGALQRHYGLAEVVAYAYAAALLTALEEWSCSGAETARLGTYFRTEIARLAAALT